MPGHVNKWLARVGEGVSTLLVARLHRETRSAHREDAVYPRPLTSNAGGAGGRGVRARGFLHRVSVSGSWTLWPEGSRREGLCRFNGRILLVNLLQSARSTFSWGSFLSFFAFQEDMLSTPISVLGGWPTVSARFSGSSSTTRWHIRFVDGPRASLGMSAGECQ